MSGVEGVQRYPDTWPIGHKGSSVLGFIGKTSMFRAKKLVMKERGSWCELVSILSRKIGIEGGESYKNNGNESEDEDDLC